MPTAIGNDIKSNVTKQWLDGDARDKIASDNHIGAGHTAALSNLNIPLAASASAGFALGMVRG